MIHETWKYADVHILAFSLAEGNHMTTYPSIEPDFSYQGEAAEAGSVNPRIRSIVLDIRARYGALRILGIGRGVQPLCYDLYHSGYSVAGIETDETDAACQAPSTPINRSCRRLIDSSPIKDAPFDMAISIEFSEPSSMPSVLIQLAAMKLQYGGVLILSIPYSGYLKNLLLTLREWLMPPYFIPWDGGDIQRWSKKCLTTLLEGYGFTVVEIIGVRGSSLEWESLILVARKTGLKKSVSDQK